MLIFFDHSIHESGPGDFISEGILHESDQEVTFDCQAFIDFKWKPVDPSDPEALWVLTKRNSGHNT